jgi:hypothetical protein
MQAAGVFRQLQTGGGSVQFVVADQLVRTHGLVPLQDKRAV